MSQNSLIFERARTIKHKIQERFKSAMARRKQLEHKFDGKVDQLEPRLLLSSTMLEDQAEILAPLPLHDGTQLSESLDLEDGLSSSPWYDGNMPAASARQLVVVDAAVEDYQSLIETILDQGKIDASDIHVLDGGQDGIAQVTKLLGKGNYKGLHLLGHGASGEIQLGATVLNGENLSEYADELVKWGQDLLPGADVFLYGCNVAEGEWGTSFVEDLAELTGVDIAASTDETGGKHLGGDWDFEYILGDVQSDSLFADGIADDYEALLKRVAFTGGSNTDKFYIMQSNIRFEKHGESAKTDGPLGGDLFNLTGNGGADEFIVQELPDNRSNKKTSKIKGGSGVDILDFSTLAGGSDLKFLFNGNPASDTEDLSVNMLSVFIGSDERFQNISNVETFKGSSGNNIYEFKSTWLNDWKRTHNVIDTASGVKKGTVNLTNLGIELDVKIKSTHDLEIARATGLTQHKLNVTDVKTVKGVANNTNLDLSSVTQPVHYLVKAGGKVVVTINPGSTQRQYFFEGVKNIKVAQGTNHIAFASNGSIAGNISDSGHNSDVILDYDSYGNPAVINTGGAIDVAGATTRTKTAGQDFTAQKYTIRNTYATAGTFTLTYAGQTTEALNVDATANDVKAALAKLSKVQQRILKVDRNTMNAGNNQYEWVIDIASTDGDGFNADTLTLTATNLKKPTIGTDLLLVPGVGANDPYRLTIGHTVNDGTFTLRASTTGTVSTKTTVALPYNATAELIEKALNALDNVSSATVTAVPNTTGTFEILVTHAIGTGITLGKNHTGLLKPATPTANNGVVPTTAGVSLVMDEYRIYNTSAGGAFTLTYGTQTTEALAYNASADEVRDALAKLSNVKALYKTQDLLKPDEVFTRDKKGIVTVDGLGTSASPWIIKIVDQNKDNQNLTVNNLDNTTFNANAASGVNGGATGGIAGLTILGINGANGQADRIFASTSNILVDGFSGQDVIIGGTMVDTIQGYAGADNIAGGAGNDDIEGGASGDILAGGAGRDFIKGDGDNDRIYGGAGDDKPTNAPLNDAKLLEKDAVGGGLFGGTGKDVIYGGTGNDWLDGGSHDDILYGGDNDDHLIGGSGGDVLYGGKHTDVLVGGGGGDYLFGGEGGDTLKGGSGADIMVGGAGADILEGGDSGDTYRFENSWGNDVLKEETNGGNDHLDFSRVTDDLTFEYKSVGLQISTSDSTLKGDNNTGIPNVELTSGGLGANTFKIFQDYVGDQTIDVSFAHSAILDLSDFPAELNTQGVTFEITFENNRVVVKQQRGDVEVQGFKITISGGLDRLSIKGSQGANRFIFKDNTTIGGTITAPNATRNVLNYSNYDHNNQGVKVNLDSQISIFKKVTLEKTKDATSSNVPIWKLTKNTGNVQGAFALKVNTSTTASLNFGSVTAIEIRDALEALGIIERAHVSGLGTEASPWIVQISKFTSDNTAATNFEIVDIVEGNNPNLAPASFQSETSEVNGRQTITHAGSAGKFSLVVNGKTTSAIDFNADADTVEAAIEALKFGVAVDVEVEKTSNAPHTWIITNETPDWEMEAITFKTNKVFNKTRVTDLEKDLVAQPVFNVDNTANSVFIKHEATGGKFKLTLTVNGNAVNTGDMDYNISKSDLKDKLNTLLQPAGATASVSQPVNKLQQWTITFSDNDTRSIAIDSSKLTEHATTADVTVTAVDVNKYRILYHNAVAGHFKIKSGSGTTAGILPHSATTAQIAAAIMEVSPNVTNLNQLTVTGTGTLADPWLIVSTVNLPNDIEILGSATDVGAYKPVDPTMNVRRRYELDVQLRLGPVANNNPFNRVDSVAHQITHTATQGSFKLKINGYADTAAISHDMSADALQTLLRDYITNQNINEIGPNITVREIGNGWELSYINQHDAGPIFELGAGNTMSVNDVNAKVSKVNGTTAKIWTDATSGSFTLTYKDMTTAAINVSTATGTIIRDALRGLTGMATHVNFTAGGNGSFANPWQFTFSDANTDIDSLRINASGLVTASSSDLIKFEQTQAGDKRASTAPTPQTYVFNIAAASGSSFYFKYGGIQSGIINYTSALTNLQVEQALSGMLNHGRALLDNALVDVTGVDGDSNTPWIIKLIDGDYLGETLSVDIVNSTINPIRMDAGQVTGVAGGIDITQLPNLSILASEKDDIFSSITTSSVEINLDGLDGEDLLIGGAGKDRITGSGGKDIIFGEDGDDTIFGGKQIDIIDGGEGADTIGGGRGDDILTGGGGKDVVSGGIDNDHVDGGAGNDRVEGSVGDDVLTGGADDDILDGGAGSDTFKFEGNWGHDVILEDNEFGSIEEEIDDEFRQEFEEGENQDTLDFTGVTDDMTLILSNGKLIGGNHVGMGPDLEISQTSLTNYNPFTGPTGTPYVQTLGFIPGQVVEADTAAIGAATTLTANHAYWQSSDVQEVKFRFMVDLGDGVERIHTLTFSAAELKGLSIFTRWESLKDLMNTKIQNIAELKNHVTVEKTTGKKMRIKVSGASDKVKAKIRILVPSSSFTNSVLVGDELDGTSTFQKIEVIKLGASSSHLIFGDDWGQNNGFWSNIGGLNLEPDYWTAIRNAKNRTLVIETSDLIKANKAGGKNKLVLDFRQNTQEIEFKFVTKDGKTAVEIKRKEDFFKAPFVKLNANIPFAPVRFNKILIKDVDEHTIIFGGRNNNSWKPDRNADYRGIIIGGSGFKPAKDLFNPNNVLPSLVTGSVPPLFSEDIIDYSRFLKKGTVGGLFRNENMQIGGIGPNIALGETSQASTDNIGQILLNGLNLLSPLPLRFNTSPDSKLDVIRFGNDKPNLPGFRNAKAVINVFDLTNSGGISLYAGHHANPTFGLKTDDYIRNIKSVSTELSNDGFNFSQVGTDLKKLYLSNEYYTGQNTFQAGKGDLFKQLMDSKIGGGLVGSGFKALNPKNWFRSGFLKDEKNMLGFFSPGVHVMAGLTGPDVYRFAGYWGLGLVMEPPKLTDIGASIDTLDFGQVNADMHYTVFEANADIINGMKNEGIDLNIGIGTNLVFATTFDTTGMEWYEILGSSLISAAGETLLNSLRSSVEAIGENAEVKDMLGLLKVDGGAVIATGVEDIIGSKGTNTVHLRGEASLEGRVTGKRVIIDYSEYSKGINANIGTKEVIVDLPNLMTKHIGNEDSKDKLKTFLEFFITSYKSRFGNVDGIDGNRGFNLVDTLALFGVDEDTPFLGDFVTNFLDNTAVTGVADVVGSSHSDWVRGNSDDNIFYSFGGNDTFDGQGGDDLFSFEQLSDIAGLLGFQGVGAERDRWDDAVTINLDTGLAWANTGGATDAGKDAKYIDSKVTQQGGYQNAQQTYTFTADSGYYTLSFDGATTGPLAYNATEAMVQTELQALSSLTNSTDLTVSENSGTFTITVNNPQLYLNGLNVKLVSINTAMLTKSAGGTVTTNNVTTDGGVDVNEVQSLVVDAASGFYTLSFDSMETGPIAHDADASAVQTALDNAGLSELTVAGTWPNLTVTFGGSYGATDVANIVAATVLDLSVNGGGSVNETVQKIAGSAGVAAVQNISHSGDQGYFTLTFDGETTDAIAFDDDGAGIEAALNALSTITSVTVEQTGTTAWKVTFDGIETAQTEDLAFNLATSLAGGTSGVVTASETTKGEITDEVQVISHDGDTGHFVITYGNEVTDTIDVGAADSVVKSKLEALTGIDGVTVVKSANTYTVTFDGATVKDQNISTSLAIVTGVKNSSADVTSFDATGSAAGDEVIKIWHDALFGTFTVTYDGETTDPIAYDATGAEVATAIGNLSKFTAANVSGSGSGSSGSKWAITFTSADRDVDNTKFSVNGNNLFGRKSADIDNRASLTGTPNINRTTVETGSSSTNAKQKVWHEASGGEFRLTFKNKYSASIAHDATAQEVEDALESMSDIGEGNVTVSREHSGGRYTWTIEFIDGKEKTAINDNIAIYNGKLTVLENVELVSGGKGDDMFIGSSSDETYVFGDNWGNDYVYDTGGSNKLDFTNAGQKIKWLTMGALKKDNNAGTATVTTKTPQSSSVDEVQELTIDATAGHFRLIYGNDLSKATDIIAYNAGAWHH